MSRVLRSIRTAAAEFARRVYGPGYWRERDLAFARSNGMCQSCGRRPAVEAHHWPLRYPSDDKVTADHLVALCRRCHWLATLTRVLDRAGAMPVWFVLATASFPGPSGGAGSAGGRRRAPHDGPRSCDASERPAARRTASEAEGPDLRALVERCHLTLLAGCLRCRRFVRVDSLPYFRRGWTGSVGDLRRRLCCCRCRSRTRWVLLAGWPPAGTGGSAERPARGDAGRGASPAAPELDPAVSSPDADSRRPKRRRAAGAR